MNGFLNVLLGFFWILGVAGQSYAAPAIDEVQVKNLQANGSGCPVGSTTKLLVDTDGSGSADFFQVTFNQFDVERPGKSKKNCLVTAVLGIPQGWSFSVINVQYEGYAEIHKKHIGRLTTKYNFPFFSNSVTTQKNIPGYFEGEYSKQDTLGLFATVWSPCGKVAPLNMNSRLMISQKPRTRGGNSFMDVERQSGLLVQKWHLKWRRCRS